MSTSNELRVFISSTFSDLQEEREHLIKKIFPEIRSLCRERGIRFTEVDLRWGLTDEDAALGQVVRLCLEEVEKCRPYFIGITGDRYGYVPSYLDIQKDPSLLERYPWIEDAAMEEMSITEMETQHGVFSPLSSESDPLHAPAHFYFRRHRASLEENDNNDELTRLEVYQQRIRQSGAVVEQFRDPVSLGELIYDDLIAIIKRDFADARPPTPLEQERARHEAFSLSRRRAYIANPVYLKRLNDHVTADHPPLVVYAESGSGKSSLFAFWAGQYRRKHPDAHVIEHYVGIGATATDHYAIIQHLCMEIKERFAREEEIPTTPEELESAFGQWLGYADHGLKQDDGHLVLILDGLNQLQGIALNLRWIPDVISPRIRLILSSTVEGTLVELRKRGWNQFGVQALSEAEREAVVVRYLAEYHKSLNPEQINKIASDYKCGHPLFLKTLLEELRLVGQHEVLDERISSYLDTTGTEDLFQRVLERLEDDYSQRAVRDVMSLLLVSRNGLDDRELSEISGLARLKIATMTAGLDYHLVRKEGRLTFFHDYLRRAVEKRYLAEDHIRRRTYVRLAEYFETEELTERSAGERVWGYAEGGDEAKLVATLGNLEVLKLLYTETGVNEVLTRWARLRKDGHDPETIYRASLNLAAGSLDPAVHLKSVTTVADLLERLGIWSGAIDLLHDVLAEATRSADSAEAARAEQRLGRIAQLRGEHVEALERLERALELYEELDDRGGVATAVGNMGTVYHNRGEYDRALESYERCLSISEELGARRNVATAVGNIGSVHAGRAEYERALRSFEKKLAISDELGDRSGVATAVGSMGSVYSDRGEHERALESFMRQLQISEELGDRWGVSRAVGNMGVVYTDRGEHDRALESYERCLSISEELGDQRGISRAVGNMGSVYGNRGEYDRALESFRRQLQICEELGDRRNVATAVGNIGSVYAGRGEYELALQSFEQNLAISQELGDRRGVAIVLGKMGEVYARRGEYEEALERFSNANREHRELGFGYGLTDALEGSGRLLHELVLRGGEMPPYLPTYLPGAGAETWQSLSLALARASAEECITISTELSKSDTLFSGGVLLARVESAEENAEGGRRRLLRLLEETADGGEQRGAAHYWLWKLALDPDTDHRGEADRIYTTLSESVPKHEYKVRIEELQAAKQNS